MKKYILTSFLFLASISAFAQNDTLTKKDLAKELNPLKTEIQYLQKNNDLLKSSIQTLQSENSELKSGIRDLTTKFTNSNNAIEILNTKLTNANNSIDSLKNWAQVNSNAIKKTANELGVKITNSESNTNEKISSIDQSLSRKSLYGIIGVLLAILISGLIYWLLSKRQKTDKTEVIDQLSKTKNSIEKSLVKEFGKQTDLMQGQLELLENQRSQAEINPNAEPDHSLALKVASEINLIERNVSLMESGTRGLKQLIRSVGKLKDNLSANGYEMPELLGKQFHQGMKVIVTSSIPDEDMEKGSEVITKVLIPQVNFNDKMIQTAQIEVSVGM